MVVEAKDLDEIYGGFAVTMSKVELTRDSSSLFMGDAVVSVVLDLGRMSARVITMFAFALWDLTLVCARETARDDTSTARI